MEVIECWVDDEDVFHWHNEIIGEDSSVESLDDSIVVQTL